MFATNRRTIDLARRERRSGNLPEVALWRVLRTRPGGFKFRRQHPLGLWSLDFACLSARVAIEVDGEIHNRGDRPSRDLQGDAALAKSGFGVLRLPASVVLTDLDAAVQAIVAFCRERPTPPPSLRDGPPPRSGEV